MITTEQAAQAHPAGEGATTSAEDPDDPDDGAVGATRARLHGAVRTMVKVRWTAVVFCLVQIFTFYQPYPDRVMAVALGLAGLLAVGNAIIAIRLPRDLATTGVRRLALGGLTLDVAVVLGLVTVYTFDAETAMFAVIYLLPLEAAILFGIRGALGVMSGATLLYVLREIYGEVVYGHDLLWASITFRMGIGWLIAWVAGAIASSLLTERDRVAEAKHEVEAHARELVRANAELQLANEIKDDFVAMTNHELRTPLTTILGYSSTLDLRWDSLPEERRREFVHQIDEQGRRLSALVEGLLTISSARAGAMPVNLQPVRLCAAIESALQGYEDLAPRVRCAPEIIVEGDPARLHQILLNLLTNARKYGQPPVHITCTVAGAWAELRVIDHGPGVPEEFVPLLFEKFSQASQGDQRSAEGAGLGLAIVRQLVQAQGGSIHYEPGSPTGSSFCVRLPVVTST